VCLCRWATTPIANTVCRRLRMTVRAEKPEVLRSVVEWIAVDVVDFQPERETLPHAVATTAPTSIGNGVFDHRSSEPVRTLFSRWLRSQDEHVLPRALVSRWLALVVDRACEMRCIQLVVLDPSTEMRMRAAGPPDIEVAQHARDARRGRYGVRENLPRVLDWGRHGRTLCRGSDRMSQRQSRPRSLRSFATWPVAFTLYCACSTFPSSSMTKVDRMTPVTVLP
jgi:hypothetical protein